VIDARKQKLATRLTELIEILRNRYSLGYYPSNRAFDGKFRKIKLKVSPEVEKREGKIVITTRRGYIGRGCPGMQANPQKLRITTQD